MFKRILAGVSLAGFTLVALVALAQQPRGTAINLGGAPFVVDAWGPAGYVVNSPSGSRPWASVTFWPPKSGTDGEWKVNWQNIPKSRAGTSCADEEKWVRALAERAGFTVRSVSVEAGHCKKDTGWGEALDSRGAMVVEPAQPQPPPPPPPQNANRIRFSVLGSAPVLANKIRRCRSSSAGETAR